MNTNNATTESKGGLGIKLSIVVAVILCFSAYQLFSNAGPSDNTEVNQSDQADSVDVLKGLTWTDTDSNKRDSSSVKGKVVFVNIWATWCPPCVREMPSIAGLYGRFKNDDSIEFLILGQDGLQKAKEFGKRKQLDLPLAASNGPLPEALRTGSIPATFLIAADGTIFETHMGAKDWNTDEVEATLRKLMRAAKE